MEGKKCKINLVVGKKRVKERRIVREQLKRSKRESRRRTDETQVNLES